MKSKGAKNLLLAAALVSTIGSRAMAQDVATIETQAANSDVVLSSDPVITAILSQPGTVNGHTYTGYSFLAQDSSGSLDFFYSTTASSYVPVVGNAISVSSGNFSPFDGIPEVANSAANPLSISTVSTGNPVLAPTTVTIPQINVTSLTANNIINTPYAGYYVQLNDVTISGAPATFPNSTASYTITDGSNNSMVWFFWESSYSTDGAMIGTSIPTGPVDMDGFVDYFANSSEAEFVATSITPVPEPAPIALGAISSILSGLFFYRVRKTA